MEERVCAARASSIVRKFPASQAFSAAKAAESAAAFALDAVRAARTVDLTSSAAETAAPARAVCQDMSGNEMSVNACETMIISGTPHTYHR